MKKFVMYGAGNIGRGFIGQTFSDAGYSVGFVDINKEVIGRLNQDKCYPVNVVTTNENVEKMVENVYGIDGTDIELVSNELPEQMNLFTNNENRVRREKLEDTIEELRGRFGKEAITYASLLGDLKIPTDGREKVKMPGAMFR